MRLVPMPPGYFAGGDILWNGRSIVKATESEMRKIRGILHSAVYVSNNG
jgi:peptide/nickel transport system ATP-binding protein